MIRIDETYINQDTKSIFDDLLEKARIYNILIDPESNEENRQTPLLLDLKRIGSAPAYLLLVYLYSLEEDYFHDKEKEKIMEQVLGFLVKYYLRRNVTDFPNTRDLDAINIDLIEMCQQEVDQGKKLDAQFIIDTLLTKKGKPSSIQVLNEKLSDNLFFNNAGMARYVLTKVSELSHSKEYRPDLWQRNAKGLLVWTVEHIFPQGDNIPDYWIKMVADGNREKAYEVQNKWVHCLGNLTLSGYNSQLSNASFERKQDLQENRKFLGYTINIGYKNGLPLNTLRFEYKDQMTSLSDIKEWNADAIETRNKVLVGLLLKIFAFDEKELQELEQSNT